MIGIREAKGATVRSQICCDDLSSGATVRSQICCDDLSSGATLSNKAHHFFKFSNKLFS
jgi:hypothetical protein